MSHWRQTCLIGDPSKTNITVGSNRNFNTFKYSYFYIVFAYLILEQYIYIFGHTVAAQLDRNIVKEIKYVCSVPLFL